MQVVKRDGKREPVSFVKIEWRLSKLSSGLSVDATSVAQKIIASVKDGISTTELDELAAQTAAAMSATHPDYGVFAARIAVSNLHKNVPPEFGAVCASLHSYRRGGEHAPLVSDELLELSEKYEHEIETALCHDRDYESYDYFGFKTLERSYLLRVDDKPAERPQHMLMRVALGIHGEDVHGALESYDLMSRGLFTHASPTLFNAGTPRASMSSCFLLDTQDSIEDIFKTVSESAVISKSAGGIGINLHSVRASGSYIRGTNGKSNGVIPFVKVLNETGRAVDQGGGRRKGAIAVYLAPWHGDVFDFLELRKNRGAEELRARDIFLGLWIPDIFMRRVEEDADWTLMCPNVCKGLPDVYGEEFDALYEKYEREGLGMRTIKARELWNAVLDSQIETGNPYMLYSDAINRHSNQKNLGTIKSSNLCVAPETRILTKGGYHPIASLAGRRVEVWNGEEFSETTVLKTGEAQKLLTVTFSNGTTLRCTPYHKFYIETGSHPNRKSVISQVDAKDLSIGDRIPRTSFPIVTTGADNTLPLDLAYTHGAYCGDGTYHYEDGKKLIHVYRPDKTAIFEETLVYTKMWSGIIHGRFAPNDTRTTFTLVDEIPEKYYVPMNAPIETRLRWLEGYSDADGSVQDQDGVKSIRISSVEFDFLDKIRLMLQTMGVDSTIGVEKSAGTKVFPDHRGGNVCYDTRTTFRLGIDSFGISTLKALGFSAKRMDIAGRDPPFRKTHFTRVVSVRDDGETADTYCFNEPKRHAGIFEGVLGGNCTEIVEYTSETETACCNLGSIALSRFVETRDSDDEHGRPVGSLGARNRSFDFKGLAEAARVLTRNLNKVVDRTFYPSAKSEYSNRKNRPIGIGVQGLADAFVLMGLPFDSTGAAKLNRRIFETIYFAALDASCDLAAEHGPYDSYEGSPISVGVLHFDSFGTDPDPVLALPWSDLRRRIARHGVRNSLLVAPMPTASTAQILGNNECFEPFTSNVYVRRVLSGEFVLCNKHLVSDLVALGLWTPALRNDLVLEDGSVQGLDIPDSLKAIYKTAWEISGRSLVDLAAGRQAFIDQSQSLNVFMADPKHSKLTSYHFYAWKKGLKTGSYYIRIRAASSAIKFTATKVAEKNADKEATEAARLACSLENPEGCVMCSG
jgi:ribonucleoside-diphosphate reductase alpha chain